jgi:prevent-host-death family protein
MKSVSAADANRHFSRLLREVARGARITVTSRGKPVATISGADGLAPERDAARRDLLARLRKLPAGTSGRRDWTRDDLYD